MSLPYYSIAGHKRVSDLVKYETHPEFCREGYTLLAGSGAERHVDVGTVLAMSYGSGAVSVTTAADAGNTGNGTLTLADPAHTSAVKPGDYTVVCTTGGVDGASKFRVEDPEGNQVGTATGGTAFAKQIRFTVAGGAANFVEGDRFTVSVAIDIGDASNKIVAWDPAATDGTERIWGLGLNRVTAPDGVDATDGLALRRGPAVVVGGAIAWPAAITADEKAEAILALEERGIVVR